MKKEITHTEQTLISSIHFTSIQYWHFNGFIFVSKAHQLSKLYYYFIYLLFTTQGENEHVHLKNFIFLHLWYKWWRSFRSIPALFNKRDRYVSFTKWIKLKYKTKFLIPWKVQWYTEMIGNYCYSFNMYDWNIDRKIKEFI